MATYARTQLEPLYVLYRFTSCPFVTRMYMFGNHRHVCDDCKCIRCVVQRWVRTPTCNCKLPHSRKGLALDARIRMKRLACPHEPQSVPVFPREWCFCSHPEKREIQLRMANPSRSYTSDSDEYDPSDIYGGDYSDESECEIPSVSQVTCFGVLRGPPKPC